jgi:hypothetical protein
MACLKRLIVDFGKIVGFIEKVNAFVILTE